MLDYNFFPFLFLVSGGCIAHNSSEYDRETRRCRLYHIVIVMCSHLDSILNYEGVLLIAFHSRNNFVTTTDDRHNETT